MIAAYVVAWTMFVGSICIFILHLLLKRTDLLIRYGIGTLLVSSFLIILRIVIPYEFNYVLYQIELPSIIFSPLKRHYVGRGDLLLTDLILYVYLAVTVLLLIHHFGKLHLMKKKLWQYSLPVPEAEAILHEIDPNSHFIVRSNPIIKTPLLSGHHNPIIYLPEYNLNTTNLYHILLHEYIHWSYHHPIIKKFMQMIRILLWWNPLAYLLEKDISHLLELVCDDIVSQRCNESERISYMNTILHCLISASKSRNPSYGNQYFIGFSKDAGDASTMQRFHYQLSKDDFKGKPVWKIIIYSVLIACFAASYLVVVKPAFSPAMEEEEDGIISTQDAYLEELEDGNYNFRFNDQVIWVPKEDVDAGFYYIYEIIPYKEK